MEDDKFFRGLLFGMPLGFLMWAGLLYWIFQYAL
jgi:hypothetical protein